MRLTRSGANDLPARRTTGRTYGQHDKAAFAGRSWTRGRSRSDLEGKSWEQRHIRVTFWLDRTLREEVREAAEGAALSITQFIAQALRRAVDDSR